MKKYVIPILLTASLCGCSFGSSIDTLMSPPKLSLEQEQIYNALTDAAGSSISLKYPKIGNYLSAFIIDDIDGDGGNEAVVFYEKKGLAVGENTLRINILDQFDNKWRSVCDSPIEGSEIEKVSISKLGSNDRTNLIIGSNLINRSEKSVAVYTYSDGTIDKTFSSAYSFFDITDMDKDDENEFLLLTGSSSGSPAVADAYKLDSNGMYVKFSQQLSGSFTEFVSLTYGSIGSELTGLYIDAVSSSGLIQTDIVYMDKNGLHKVFSSPEQSISTIRPYGCSSYDIDGDGSPEIPVQTVFPNYREAPEGEQIMVTEWLCLNDKFRLVPEYSSYFSINDGYIFILPDRWRNKVTVIRDVVNDEMVFCACENNSPTYELMRISCVFDSASLEDRISGGYMLMHSKGELSCLALIAPPTDDGSGMELSAAEAAVCFKYID